jgi:hypothetical protein
MEQVLAGHAKVELLYECKALPWSAQCRLPARPPSCLMMSG